MAPSQFTKPLYFAKFLLAIAPDGEHIGHAIDLPSPVKDTVAVSAFRSRRARNLATQPTSLRDLLIRW